MITGTSYIDNPTLGEGIDVYRNGTHVLRVDNAGNVHVYYGKILLYRDDVEVKGNLHVSGKLDVKGNIYIEGKAAVQGELIVGSSLEVGGDLYLHGDIVQTSGKSAIIAEPDPPTSPLGDLPNFPTLDSKPSF